MRIALLLSAALIACVACSTPSAINQVSSQPISALYMPLQLSTYTAVTVDNLHAEGSCALADSSGELRWLLSLGGFEPGASFDQKRVRARISDSSSTVFVDTNAVLLNVQGERPLSDSERSRLVKTLETLRHAGSCDRYDWLDK